MLFLESPWPILVLGLVIELCLAAVLFQTGRGALIYAMSGVALVVMLGVLLERNTITDTKRVRQTLDEVAAGLMANNAERVYQCIEPGTDGNAARGETNWALRVAEFREISIRNLEVKFNHQMNPPTAETSFNVVVRGKVRGGEFADVGEITRLVKMEVKLRKHSARWLIYGEPKHNAHE